ncbi:DUF6344 domain-containing protein [Streptomyces sp. NPDC060048]|uniref:DUF6344 domain-containing protein n=1 Tax=unclassified Streptomyces TaxID=2593676 RepID=UPI0036CAE677
MAHRSTTTSIWTTFLAALVAFFAGLGLGLVGKAAPAAASPSSASTVPAAPAARPAFMARRTWRAMMRGGSLPPTIKQRIRAEAHGKTPTVRRSTTAAALAAGSDFGTGFGTDLGTDLGSASGLASGAAESGGRAAVLAAAGRVAAARREMALAA